MRSRFYAALISVVSLLALTGCPPTPPCDEKISDPDFYKARILSSPAIQQVGSLFPLEEISVSPCFVDGKLSATLRYKIPDTYSNYSIAYRDILHLTYAKDSSMEILDILAPPIPLNVDSVVQYFQKRIAMIESNPRIQELILMTGPDPYNPASPLMTGEVMRSGYNRAEYNFEQDNVFAYTLSNDIPWQQYPEVAIAHRAIKEHLLTRDLASCSIGRGEAHAYTTARGDSAQGTWYITVALICGDGWKDAFVQVNRDSSFEKLGIQTEY